MFWSLKEQVPLEAVKTPSQKVRRSEGERVRKSEDKRR
jgi:hypothetical protein